MNTDWTPVEKKKITSKKHKQKIYHNSKRVNNSHDVKRVYQHNLEPNTCMSSDDVLALKIHGIDDGEDSSSSNSGLSTFDEDYYKYKPQPMQIDENKIIVIRNSKNINANIKTRRNNLGTRNFNNKKSVQGSKSSTPKISMNASGIKADNNIKQDDSKRDVTKQSTPFNENGPIFTISNGQNKTMPDILAKNLVEQRRTINEIEPSALAINSLRVPINKWPIPKSTGVTLNPDLYHKRYPPLPDKVVTPDMAKTHLFSSIPSVETRKPKNAFENDFEKAYNHFRDDIEDLEIVASKNQQIKSSERQRILDEILKYPIGTQDRNKTVISSRQNDHQGYQQWNPDLEKTNYVNQVQDYRQFPSNQSLQPSLSKNKAPMDKLVNKKSSHGQETSNDSLKKPPATKNVDCGIHALKSTENVPPTRLVRPQNVTGGNTFRDSSNLLPHGNNILRHIPDQTDVIVRQPQGRPIQQTTQQPTSTLSGNADHEDDKHLLGEASEGYFARLCLFCGCFNCF